MEDEITPEEKARLAAFCAEERKFLIMAGCIAPCTAAEQTLWRETHGTPYSGPQDLKRQ